MSKHDFSNLLGWLKINKRIILIATITYLFFLIGNLPANIILTSIKLPGNVKVSDVSGTVWTGKIQNLHVSGITVGTVEWSLQPFRLLLGSLSADVTVKKERQYIKSKIHYTLTGKTELEDTRININLTSLQPLTYGMPFSYTGNLTGHLPVSYFKKDSFISLNGKLSLRNLEMVSPQRQAFGNFDIDLRAENEGMTSGLVKDNSDEISLSGKLAIYKDGLLKLSAKLAARQKDSSIDNMIAFLGNKDSNGTVQIGSSIKLW